MIRRAGMSICAVTVGLTCVAGCQQGSALNRCSAAAELPVIVRLESRHHTITARASPDGPLYTVADKSGRVVAADATLERLQASHPRIYRQISGGYASAAALDASAGD